MQTDNRFFDDISKVAGGALSALTGLKNEVEQLVRQQFEKILADMNLVTRDEFEAVQAMAARARSEQETLEARLSVLEAKIAELDGKTKAKKAAKGESEAG